MMIDLIQVTMDDGENADLPLIIKTFAEFDCLPADEWEKRLHSPQLLRAWHNAAVGFGWATDRVSNAKLRRVAFEAVVLNVKNYAKTTPRIQAMFSGKPTQDLLDRFDFYRAAEDAMAADLERVANA